MSWCFCLTVKEVLTVAGLLCDLIGVYLLTISGILGENPLRRWRQLRNLDQEKLTDEDPDLIIDVEEDGSPTDKIDEIETWENWQRLLSRARKRVSGVTLLMVGFTLQIVGNIV